MTPQLMRAVEEWRWYYGAASSEMGIRSSWCPLVALAQMGGSHGSPDVADMDAPMTDARLAAAERERRINRALERVPAEQVRHIRLACEDELSSLRAGYGEFGNLAHLTTHAGVLESATGVNVDEYARAFLSTRGKDQARTLIAFGATPAAAKVREETVQLMESACRSYVEARKRDPPPPRRWHR